MGNWYWLKRARLGFLFLLPSSHAASTEVVTYLKKMAVAFLSVSIFLSGVALAQPQPSGADEAIRADNEGGYPQLPALRADEVVEKGRDFAFCSESDCYLTAEQFRALSNAAKLYKKDMPQGTPASMVVSIESGLISATAFPKSARPTDFGSAGDVMAITYLFDATGEHVVKQFYNR
ncbi:hypothetical protein FHW69_003719 [Luteibacter sp. Sphag1AF]|uniref:hypothetical protein n=1 Tax=Luteibacter sp. Sphag1AF TaxID=2587031 RepID=UPI00161515F1|nr:hypothetical protein [Luteibacter sp. Sphag1AF]MBB3229070.1 hypothetical protein [Luteibacter sp. Sphag1AF]